MRRLFARFKRFENDIVSAYYDTDAFDIQSESLQRFRDESDEPKKQFPVGALPQPALSLIHATLFQNPQTRQTARALASTCRHIHRASRNQSPVLTNLLGYIARGQLDKAEAILKKRPELAFKRGHIVDDVGREYQSISPWEYAIWVGDPYTQPHNQWKIVNMIADYIEPGIEAICSRGLQTKEQIEQLNSALQMVEEVKAIIKALCTQDPTLTQILTDVTRGKQSTVEAILDRKPELVFTKGYVKDHAGRLFHVSPFQLALWCGDFKMWGQLTETGEMEADDGLKGMRHYFERIEDGCRQAKTQFEEQATQGCRYHGAHFDKFIGHRVDNAFTITALLAIQNNEYGDDIKTRTRLLAIQNNVYDDDILRHRDRLWLARAKTQQLEPACLLQWRANFTIAQDRNNVHNPINIPNYLARVRPGNGPAPLPLFPLDGGGGNYLHTHPERGCQVEPR